MERSVKCLGSKREEAKTRYVVQSSECSGGNLAAVLWLCVHYYLSEDTTKFDRRVTRNIVMVDTSSVIVL